ncbi:MAG: ORF6N domain-containing protein [Erysipelotrichales bacterium]|nr:ORF6N domain-containing protein [Erysipelotrichales bacterium]
MVDDIINTAEKNIQDMIYIVRGQQVMLDSDLAKLYGYETKNLNRQVKRNSKKSPEDMMFQLTQKEIDDLRCPNVTANINSKSRSLSYFFTEQGIYMLATVLKGELATKQTLTIIRAFKEIRHFIISNNRLLTHSEYERLSLRIDNHDMGIGALSNQLNAMMNNFINEENVKEYVFIDNQKFEANETYVSIYRKAKKSIYILDDYINIDTLSYLKHKNVGVDVLIFSDNKGSGHQKLRKIELDNFNKEYPLVEIKKTNNKTHDRLIVLDYKLPTEEIYLCGASSKDAGIKFCTIIKVQETSVFHKIIDDLLFNQMLPLS